ncbi:MAG TPA: M43 family zinc metalloprotease [Flavipsychrobacter sp.]|nr:M43 family zinc metalloprotease [Flavipsychrobacter sp.]
MIRKVTLLFLACLGMFVNGNAQYCGFDELHQQALAQNPVYAQKVQQMNAKIAQMTQYGSKHKIVNTLNGPVYQIPVVVHVIHTGGAIGTNYNPDSAQIANMIAYLNQSYAATWPSYPNATNGGTYIPLQFVLAKRTPQCTPTNGIIRVNGSVLPNYATGGINRSQTIGEAEATVKALSIWPNTEYYNIWIVNRIDGKDGFSTSGSFTAGFAWFPGANPNVDGTVMLAYTAQAGEITLPHEVGHAFALNHTFDGDGGGSVCPPNNNCLTDGDEVCDTDPHMRSNFNCPSGTNPCTNAPFGTVVNNFMDYSNCQNRFTPGQSVRVLNALLTTNRASLISSLGGEPLPPTSLPSACVPTSVTNPGTNSGVWDVTISDASITYLSVGSQGYSGDGNKFYVDNTCKHQVELTAGNIYNFEVTTGPVAEKGKVFVDYNNDGIFQGSEEIYSYTGTSGFQTHSFQYTVPTTTTIPSLVSCVPLRMRIVSDRIAAPAITACPASIGWGQVEDYTIVIRGGGATTGSVSVSLTAGSNPSCFNSPLTFTAVPGQSLIPNGYHWYVNGGSTGITTNTFSSSTLANGDVVAVKMYYAGPCGNDSTISMNYLIQRAATVPAAVSIVVTSGTNPGCPGQMLTFTANPINGGTAPVYQWKVNGNPVGTNSPSYSAVFNNNDVISVDMVSNSACASPTNATSPAITIQHLFDVQNIAIGLTSGTLPACSGKPLTFTALVTNGGSNPQIQWLVNGIMIPGATSNTFTATNLTNNDVITATSVVTGPCIFNPADTSDPIVVSIIPSNTPNISVAITKGSNPGCLDSLIEFTATVMNHGLTPDLIWYVNGIAVDTGYIYSSNTLFNGDVVTLRSAATDTACYTSDTLFSAPITMVRSSTPAAPLISLISNMLVSNVSGNLQWFGPNGVKIPGATNPSYHPTQPGAYYAVVYNNGCNSAPSNVLTVSLLDIATYDMSQVKVYPNPTEGMLTLDWGSKLVDVKIDIYSSNGQGLLHETLKNGSRKQINLSHFANGNYFIVIRDNAGNIGSARITLSK